MNIQDERREPIVRARFFDTLADTQMEPSEVSVNAGIADLKVSYRNGKVSIPVLVSVLTSTGKHRGVHMSRLVQAASRSTSKGIESWLKDICADVNKSQSGSIVSCRFEIPYADQFVPVVIRTRERGAITYQLKVTGMTACPCSKKMIGIGHMQRAEISAVIKTRRNLKTIETIQKIEECFSAFPSEKMKRVEEAKKILEAQENPKFAEDLLRECLKRFPDALSIVARCFESIHTHDAIASWSRKEDWVPAI